MTTALLTSSIRGAQSRGEAGRETILTKYIFFHWARDTSTSSSHFLLQLVQTHARSPFHGTRTAFHRFSYLHLLVPLQFFFIITSPEQPQTSRYCKHCNKPQWLSERHNLHTHPQSASPLLSTANILTPSLSPLPTRVLFVLFHNPLLQHHAASLHAPHGSTSDLQ